MTTDIIKPGIVLCIITVIAAILLGTVYEITKEPIARQQLETRNSAMRELLPSATDFHEGSAFAPENGVTSYFQGVSSADNSVVGYVIGCSSIGYSGNIDLLVAIDMNNMIQGIKIVKQTETPGLGSLAVLPKFTDQFKNKTGELVVTKKDSPKDNEVEAITASTITSKAVVSGVNAATEFFESNLLNGNLEGGN